MNSLKALAEPGLYKASGNKPVVLTRSNGKMKNPVFTIKKHKGLPNRTITAKSLIEMGSLIQIIFTWTCHSEFCGIYSNVNVHRIAASEFMKISDTGLQFAQNTS